MFQEVFYGIGTEDTITHTELDGIQNGRKFVIIQEILQNSELVSAVAFFFFTKEMQKLRRFAIHSLIQLILEVIYCTAAVSAMAGVLNQFPSAVGNSVFTDWITKSGTDIQGTFTFFNLNFFLVIVGSKRN